MNASLNKLSSWLAWSLMLMHSSDGGRERISLNEIVKLKLSSAEGN
ncbi:MAG: hypothetical protein ACTS5F_00150 [Candidatus Hodgkinia cicadicola]